MTGKVFGTLHVLEFDSERHERDKVLVAEGKLDRLRRYYLCKCEKCGRIVSVRGENLTTGNTKGCGCDRVEKIIRGYKETMETKFRYDDELCCWVGKVHNTGSEFLFDDCDYDVVTEHTWYETNRGYIMTRLNRKEQIFLHRLLIFGAEGSKENSEYMVDHINRNTLDNRRSNLRKVTPQQNAWNSGVRKNSQSKVRGVSYYEPTQKWRAVISSNGEYIHLGYFDNKSDAEDARKMAEAELYGEYAPIYT